MWNMGLDFSVWRLFGISIMAILGMLVWIMVSHGLWESTKKLSIKIVMLYNLTTIMTLFIAIVIYYMILYSLF